MPTIHIADSVTTLPPEARGAVLVAASHGGRYAAYLAAFGGARGVILNDAGGGLDRAGLGGLALLDEYGIPAATVAHTSCRIGDGADMARRGRISAVNDEAARLHCVRGEACLAAAEKMRLARPFSGSPAPIAEARWLLDDGEPLVWGLDSNGLVVPGDAGAIVVTGSHGGLLGGRPETAVKAPVRAAVYNDAGIGIDEAGLSRLPVLAARGIAAATVAAASARIGEARSTWETGRLSAVNAVAASWGAVIGMTVPDFVAAVRRAGPGAAR